MKKLFILFFLILSACSNNSPEAPKEIPSEEVYNLDANGIGFFSGSPQAENNPVDLLTVVQGQKKTLSVTIKNMGTVATPLLSASLSDTKFYITSSSCSNKSLPPNGGSCSLTLNFSSVGKALQVFESNINFGPSTIPVKIEVISSSGQGGGGSALIKMYDGTTQIVSPPDYSIGSVSGTAKISKVITIKNEGTAATLIGDAVLSSSSFYLTSNGCVGKALVAGASCSATVNFSGSGKIAGQSYPVNLTYAGASVSLVASTQAPPPPAPAQLVFMDGTTTLSQDLHLGSYLNNLTLSKTISVKNIGASPSSTLSLQLLNNTVGYFTISNSCNNIILGAGSSCSFSLRVSTNKPAGVHAVTLKMDQTTQIVDFEKLAPAVITYQAEYQPYSACSVTTPCLGQGTQTRTYACAKFSDGVAAGYGQLSDCTPSDLSISCNSPPGDGTVAMPHGSKVLTCDAGATTGVFVSGVCTDAGYNLVGEVCEIQKFTLSVSKSKSYGDVTSQPLGINCANVPSCQFDFDYGTAVTLYPTINSGNGYEFGGWSGACSGMGSCTVSVDSAKSVEMIVSCSLGFHEESGACVIDQNILTATVAGSIGGSVADGNSFSCLAVNSPCSNSYFASSTVTLTAMPDAGYTFTGWSGDCSGNGICSVDMLSAKNVTATFTETLAPHLARISNDNLAEVVDSQHPIQVQVVSSQGNPVAGEVVVIRTSAGSVVSQSSVSDSNGFFDAIIQFPQTVTAFTVSATLGSEVITFSFNTYHGPLSQLVFVSQPLGGVFVNDPLISLPTIEGRDLFGNLTTSSSVSLVFEAASDPTCSSIVSGAVTGGSGLVNGVSTPSVTFSQSGNFYLKVSQGSFVSCSSLITILEPSTTDPEVVLITPAAGGLVPTATATEFTVTFDRDMDQSTYLASNIYMNGGTLILNTAGSSATQLKFSVPSGLTNNQSYNIFLTSGIKDLNGRSLVPYALNVYTGSPSLEFSPLLVSHRNLTCPEPYIPCGSVVSQSYAKDKNVILNFYATLPVGETWTTSTPMRMLKSIDGGETFTDEAMPSDFDGSYLYPDSLSVHNNKLTLVFYDVDGVGTDWRVGHYNGSSWEMISNIPNPTNMDMNNVPFAQYDGSDYITIVYNRKNPANQYLSYTPMYVNRYNLVTHTWGSEQLIGLPESTHSSVQAAQTFKLIAHGVNDISILFSQGSIEYPTVDLYAIKYNPQTQVASSLISLENTQHVFLLDPGNMHISQNSSGKVLLAVSGRQDFLGDYKESLQIIRYNGTSWKQNQIIMSDIGSSGIYNIVSAVSDNNSFILAFAQVGPGDDDAQTAGYAYRVADISSAAATLSMGTKTKISSFSETFSYYGTNYNITAGTNLSSQYPFGSNGSQNASSTGFPLLAISPSGEAVITWQSIMSPDSGTSVTSTIRTLFNRYVPGVGWSALAKSGNAQPYLYLYENLVYSGGEFKLTGQIHINSTSGPHNVLQITSISSKIRTTPGVMRAVKRVTQVNSQPLDYSFNYFAFNKTSATGRGIRLFKKQQYTTDNALYYSIYTKSTDNWGAAAEVVPSSEGLVSDANMDYSRNDRGDVAIAWSTYNPTLGLYEVKMRRFLNSTGAWSTTRIVGSTNGGLTLKPRVAVDETGKVYVIYSNNENIADVATYLIRGRSYNGDASATAVETSAQIVHMATDGNSARYTELEVVAQGGRVAVLHNSHETHRMIGFMTTNFNNAITYTPYAEISEPVGRPIVLMTASRTAVIYIAPKAGYSAPFYTSLYMTYKDGAGNFSTPALVDQDDNYPFVYSPGKAFIKSNGDIDLIYAGEPGDKSDLFHRSFASNQWSSITKIPQAYGRVNIWDASVSSAGTLLVTWGNSYLGNGYYENPNIYYSIKQPGLNWSSPNFFYENKGYYQHGTYYTYEVLFSGIDNFGRILGSFNTPILPENNINEVYGRSINY